jgi:RecB family exonuclease
VHTTSQPLAAPIAVTTLAAGEPQADPELSFDAERLRKAEGGRFGKLFGATVHRALELLALGAAADAPDAVALATREIGFEESADAAIEDVVRARMALAGAGIAGGGDIDTATEYPLCMLTGDGQLLSGVIDLLASDAETVTAIDFKTDVAPKAAAERVYPEYAAQLRLYGDMLREAGIVGQRRLRLGLLFTENGQLHWIG